MNDIGMISDISVMLIIVLFSTIIISSTAYVIVFVIPEKLEEIIKLLKKEG